MKLKIRKKKILKFAKNNFLLILALLSLIPIFIILYKIHIPRVNDFGCFDDCNNFMRGYFILQGKSLFSEVFSGHQPLGSYLSTVIQYVTNPQNIYELILRHRQFMLLFSFLFNAIIILRFGAKFILFTLIFEFSNYYLFGDRFLGDGMIVYVFIYLSGLVFLKFRNDKLHNFDFILASIFAWFIIFMRVPYAPATLLVYFIILWSWPIKKISKISFSIFFLLSFITVFAHDVAEYFYNVVAFNFLINIPAEAKPEMIGHRVFHWFLYPVYIFFYGPLNIFKTLLIGLNIIFIFLFVNLLWNRKFKLSAFIFITLGLLNIRTVLPGLIFYNAFHMLVWYGLYVFVIIDLLFQKRSDKKIFYSGIVILALSFLLFILNPSYFPKIKIDPHEQFLTNYGLILQEGEVIRALSSPGDTLFIDGSEDLIYWQAKVDSPYKYSWYTSSMPFLNKYTDERIEMFKNDPPDFYREYGMCPKAKDVDLPDTYRLPDFIKDQYVRLYSDKPTCLFINKNKIPNLTEDQIKKAEDFLYRIPKTN